MYIREQLSVLEKRILENKNLIQVITGPRQVGKTTLALQLIEKTELEHNYVSADAVPSSSSGWIEQQWEATRIKLKSSNKNSILLIIDEIQKIDNWSEYVKKEWDIDRKNKLKLKVVLLGSSTLLIDKGLSESLAGRFELTKLPHWNLSEMKDAFNFTPEEYVYFGGYPGAAELINDEQRWRDYILNSIIETTISKDILQLTNIQKPALLKNLFELACTFNGEILSYTKILGQLTDAGNTTTLSHYQNLLDKVWFISGLQKFSGSKVIQKLSIPKWLAYNTAFVSVYADIDYKTTKKTSDIWGRRIEQAIGAHLLNQSRILGINVYYWREGNNEVDYIIRKGSKIISIEVKSGKFKTHKGLEEFKKKYKPYKSILISNDSLTWQEFLKLNLNELFD